METLIFENTRNIINTIRLLLFLFLNAEKVGDTREAWTTELYSIDL